MATVTDPPPGRASKPEDLEYHDDWEADDSEGQWICEELNLGKGRPIMFEYSGLTYMFEAGGKFYFWYCMDLSVSEITSPRKLDEIIKTMKEKGEGALKIKKNSKINEAGEVPVIRFLVAMRSFHNHPSDILSTLKSQGIIFRCYRSSTSQDHSLSFLVRSSIGMDPVQLGPAAATPFSEQILLAFNRQIDIRVAYTWNRDTVISSSGHH